MGFDPHKYALSPNAAAGDDAWLLNHRGAWLDDERKPSNLDTMTTECVYGVVGEQGSGKTTVLGLVAEDERERGGFVLMCDFQNAHQLRSGGPMKIKRAINVLARYFRDLIQKEAKNQGVEVDLKVARIRFAIDNYQDDLFDRIWERYPNILSMSPRELLSCDDIVDSVREFERRNPNHLLSLDAIQYLPDRRTLILFDNVEGLGAQMRRLLFDKMVNFVQPSTLLFIAIRSENRSELKGVPQGRRVVWYPLSQERDSLMRIARIRNDGARGLCDVNGSEPGEAERFHREFERSIRLIEGSEYHLKLFTDYLNGDIRLFLTLVSDLCSDLARPVAEHHKAVDQHRRVIGIMSSHMIERRSHPSLATVFEARSIYCAKYPQVPFVFLPLRILAYLHHRNCEVNQKQLYEDFGQTFGISKSSVDLALAPYLEDAFARPSLLRRYEDLVCLLPCGETFVKEIVYQCDYLSSLYPIVKEELNGRKDRVDIQRGEMPDAEYKLRRSKVVVENLILPWFEKEHPYVKGAKMDGAMRRRLTCYSTMFGYSSGNWFVGRLRQRLEGYVRGSIYDLEQIAAPTIERLGRFETALDRLAG